MEPDPLEITDKTRIRRSPHRGSYDRGLIYGILDAGDVCHLGFVAQGQPFVIPTSYARQGDRLIVHGSVASRMLRTLAEGAPVCATITHLDGLVLARSVFSHSMNYRSVMVFGRAVALRDPEEKKRALEALVEHLVPGRSREARSSSPEELHATEVLALDLREASAKVRSGPPHDLEKDLHLPVWAGVIPLGVEAGEPVAAPDLAPGLEMPASVLAYRRRR